MNINHVTPLPQHEAKKKAAASDQNQTTGSSVRTMSLGRKDIPNICSAKGVVGLTGLAAPVLSQDTQTNH